MNLRTTNKMGGGQSPVTTRHRRVLDLRLVGIDEFFPTKRIVCRQT